MNDVSTQISDAARAVVTDVTRKDAVTAGNPATDGQGGGRELPPVSNPGGVEVAVRGDSSQQRVERAIAHMNDYVQSIQRDLKFSVDQDLGRPVVIVVDRSTQTVIRQIPNDVVVRLARNLNVSQELQEQGYVERAINGSLGLNTKI
jgi:flagellar protein FlaG